MSLSGPKSFLYQAINVFICAVKFDILSRRLRSKPVPSGYLMNYTLPYLFKSFIFKNWMFPFV